MKRKLILFAVLLFALCLVTAIACAEISNVQFRREANGKITITHIAQEVVTQRSHIICMI